jgi:Uma2 family endonuclease
MSVPRLPTKRMNVREFLAWAEKQPEGHNYELVDGEIIAMAPERVRHNLAKLAVARALQDSVQAAKLPCTVFTDGVTVKINEHTAREPDASVQRGVEAELDSLFIDAPLIVVEVASPTSERDDTGAKLVDYFSVPSIQHYLIGFPQRRVFVHYKRGESGNIDAHIAHDGDIVLDPPGMTVSVAALLGPAFAPDAEGGR